MTIKKVKSQLPEDQRVKLYEKHLSGKMTYKQLGAEFGVTAQTASNIVKRMMEGEVIKPGGHNNYLDNISTNAVPASLIISLNDAAIEAKITSAQLLHYAALGKLKLCIAVEPGTTPISSATINMINSLVDEGNDPEGLDMIAYLDKVDYLILEPKDLKQLELAEVTYRAHFSKGHLLINGQLNSRDPSVHSKEDTQKDCFFHLIRRYDPWTKPRIILKEVGGLQYIDRTKLKVNRAVLNEFIETEQLRIPSRPQIAEGFLVHANRSSLLIDLDQAAFELWGDFNPIKATRFNTPEIVADYLVSKFNFHRLHANHAAVMILPSKSNPIRSREVPYRTVMLQTLIDGWQAICLEHLFVSEEKILYDNKSSKWLSTHSLTLKKNEAMRSSASKIILSDDAKFHNPRKPPKPKKQ